MINSIKNNRGLSGSAIKIIAIVTMFIDHFGATVLNSLYIEGYHFNVNIQVLYNVCRTIGRISLPLFCFLLVEGFVHTRSQKKYALRLLIFALISEIPFEMAFLSYNNAPLFHKGYCNIFFTLFIGLITMIGLEYCKKSDSPNFIRYILQFMTIFAFGGLAEKIGADYGAYGVWMIVVMYWFRQDRRKQVVATFLYMTIYTLFGFYFQPLYLVSLLCMILYNGQKGKIKLKYFFYAFYPLHLLFLICLVRCLIK